ncbi:MAG: DUF4070 domain-containing protein [Candidatus Daviesbacteria bacterium]|nr:DUF4070 domain-containing protein [Candidatus Daviesbacteria bacterium]
MKALLVYPEYPDTFWSFRHALKFVSRKAALPPLGLLTVASMLPKRWKKKLIDANIRSLRDEDIAWADIVFIGAMIVQSKSAQEIINRCKSLGKTVVAGGPTFTTQYRKFKNVDHFVLNEAEVTMPLFLRDLAKGKSRHCYSSMIRPDVTKTPLPDWSLINFKEYTTMAVQFSRGCPFNCEFCDIVIMNGRIPRAKKPEQLIAEMQILYDKGWRGAVFIVDDNFIGNKINVKKMLPLLIEWQKKHKYPFKFITEASTNLADDTELMKQMSIANFYNVFLGLETPSLDGLNECGKFQNVKRDLTKVVQTIQKHGMQVMGGFIVGFDTDPESIFEAQIKFIQKIGVVTAMVGLLNAAPKTRLWQRLKKEKRLLAGPSGENTDGSLNFIPKMDKEKLVEGYKRILSTIYSKKHYYKRIDTFLKNYQPTVKSKLSLGDVKAFLRSIWRIGILSEDRLMYWRLIIKTLFQKRKAFGTAVEMAIYRQHFGKIVQRLSIPC